MTVQEFKIWIHHSIGPMDTDFQPSYKSAAFSHSLSSLRMTEDSSPGLV